MSPSNALHYGKPPMPFNPPLTGTPNPGLTDYIVKEKLFNFFLNDGCIPGTKAHVLVERIVTENPWPRPIAVLGCA